MRRNRPSACKNTPWTTADDSDVHKSAHRPLLLLMLTRTNKLCIKPNQTDRFCLGYIIYLNLIVRRVIGKRRGVYSHGHSLQSSWKAYFSISRSEMWVILPAARMTADELFTTEETVRLKDTQSTKQLSGAAGLCRRPCDCVRHQHNSFPLQH